MTFVMELAAPGEIFVACTIDVPFIDRSIMERDTIPAQRFIALMMGGTRAMKMASTRPFKLVPRRRRVLDEQVPGSDLFAGGYADIFAEGCAESYEERDDDGSEMRHFHHVELIFIYFYIFSQHSL